MLKPSSIKAIGLTKPAKKTPPQIADEIGLKYEKGQELGAKADILCTEAKNETYALCPKDQDRAAVRGSKFEVGYYTKNASPRFDEDLFRDLYPKEHAKCMVTKPVFDEERLRQLIKEKKISAEHFQAAVVRGSSTKVISIKRLKGSR